MIIIERDYDVEERRCNRALFPQAWRPLGGELPDQINFELNPSGWGGERARQFLREQGEDEWACVQLIDDVLVAYVRFEGKVEPAGLFAFSFEVSERPDGREPIGLGSVVRRLELDLDYIWVMPKLRGCGVAKDMLIHFFGYCGACMVLDFVPGNKIELMCPSPLCVRTASGEGISLEAL